MAVIFINRFFYPDISATSQILSNLAFALAEEGRDVQVIASRLRYDDVSGTGSLLASHDIVRGVAIHRVRTSRFGRGRLLGRAMDYLTFYAAAAWHAWRLTRASDVVVVKTDPPMLSVVIAPICRLRRAVLVNWLQDLFPEIAQVLGIGRRRRGFYSVLSWARTRSLEAAAANVAVGTIMADRIAALGVDPGQIRVIPNWSDASAVFPVPHDENPFRREAGLVGCFVVVYSGNLGRVHDVATMIEAMTLLESGPPPGEARPPIRWLFIGGGALWPSLKDEVARLGLTQVAFLPYQPTSGIAWSLSAADVHIASLRPDCEGLVVPSKVGGAAAAGRPILFVGDPDGEVGRFLARNGCGQSIAIGDGRGLARAVSELAQDPERCSAMGRRARHAFETEFDLPLALARWRALLDDVALRGERGGPGRTGR